MTNGFHDKQGQEDHLWDACRWEMSVGDVVSGRPLCVVGRSEAAEHV